MPHPFGELAIPSIELGFDTSAALWNPDSPPKDGECTLWNELLNEPSPSPYSISPALTPMSQSPERTITGSKTPSKHSPKASPSRTLSSSTTESEEERRRSRKREQNRESQRNFRRRQENRVKFLESRTLELEASSRQLRAENERLKSELSDANQRNGELFAMMSLPTTPLNLPLELEEGASQQQQNFSNYLSMSMPMAFDLNEQRFYGPPAVLQDGGRGRGSW